jgi:alanyl-tRNA synthetase
MTGRLYYTDPYQQEFETAIVAVEHRDGRTILRLGQTAFYPTSGGQPFDTGRLTRSGDRDEGGADLRVIDVL